VSLKADIAANTLGIFWAFFKELVFGDEKISVIFHRNRVAAFFMIANVVMFTLLMIMLEQAYNLQKEGNAYRDEIVQLQTQLRTLAPNGSADDQTTLVATRRIMDLETTLGIYQSKLDSAMALVHFYEQRQKDKGCVAVPAFEKPQPNRTLEQKLTAIRNEHDGQVCDPFTLPILKPIPGVPIIPATVAASRDATDTILVNKIDELRQYSADVISDVQSAQQQHLKTCR
jgi:hypothetical protein